MTWQSNKYQNRWNELEDFYKGSSLLTNKNKFMNQHNLTMIALIALTFVVAGLQAIHGLTSFDKWIDLILPLATFAEHAIGGKTT